MEIVRQTLDTFNAFMRGELSSEAAAKMVDPQFALDWYDERTLPAQHVRGAPELIGVWEQLRSVLADVTWDPLEVIEAPDARVLVSIRASGRGRESGVPFEVHYFQLWTIRDGTVRDAEFFRHRADALEAAGLSE